MTIISFDVFTVFITLVERPTVTHYLEYIIDWIMLYTAFNMTSDIPLQKFAYLELYVPVFH